MSRLTREESQERTREALIEAARAAVIQSGLEGLSVGQIAESAGFSKGAFYSNFENKEAILLELLRRHELRIVDDLRGIVRNGDLAETMANLDTWLAERHQDAEWCVMAVELELRATRDAKFAEALAKINREHLDSVTALVDDLYRKAGRQSPTNVEELAIGFIAMIKGLMLAQRGSAGNMPKELPGRIMSSFIFALLAASQPLEGLPAP